ncbi:aminopeptidase [Bacillus sp. NTK071]|uniref:aminopeptidase n=1 Tax=Bacillus sp. NTK071 TaxID=2802175 RepID=UPI001A8C08C9|nr:aminopeptidase [Bacillus sp. NTK071]MBN8210902.1 aminopeptidase [Bacillus sp. NTK071]
MNNDSKRLEKYAAITVEIGLNLQKGQTLIIDAPIHASEFVQQVVKMAYDKGAKVVMIEYTDEQVLLTKYKKAPEEGLKHYPEWKAKGYEEMAKEGAALLNVFSPNPNLLKDVDPKRVSMVQKAIAEALRTFQSYQISGKMNWCIVAVPSKEWAKQVFPDRSEEESIQLLWEQIFEVTRTNTDHPVQTWKEHVETMNRSVRFLNENNFKKLHYRANNGTSFSVELPNLHKWMCANFKSERGVSYVPNIPTEEVFTVPKREGVNGVIKSSKPLNYNGYLISGFSLTFEEGKVIDFSAEEGYEVLKSILETDEGAKCLGEIALVPYNSPISNSELVFYNTLYDENASCHVALGNGLPIALEGGPDMNKEELAEQDLNESLIHVDFMFGTADLEIDGETESGEIVSIFRNGNWGF